MYNMKKIIFLLLMPFITMAQVVVPKSTTTFSNIVATGSETVTGNLKVGGAITSPTVYGSSAASGTLNLFGTSSATAGVISVGTGTASKFISNGTSTLTGAAKQTNTLNYEGNTTWNTNQTNTLTTGNTGTVAVLSDALFSIQYYASSSSPADGTTYYIGQLPGLAMVTGEPSRVYVPYNATLVGWSLSGYAQTVVSSSETATLSANINGSPTQLSTSITYTAPSSVNTYSGSCSVSVNAGDYIIPRILCPTWATNPTGLQHGITFWFVRRQ